VGLLIFSQGEGIERNQWRMTVLMTTHFLLWRYLQFTKKVPK